MALLSPVFNIPFFTDVNGEPLAGGKIFTYEGGSSSVLKETFTTEAGDVANTNPIVLNSAGQLPAGVSIFLTAGQAYNLVLTQADGTTVLKGFDGVYGVSIGGGGGGGGAGNIWISAEGGTYLSPTSFLVPDNLTVEFAVGNRARLTTAGGLRFGTVTAVSFSSPNTTVTILNDGSPLDSSLELAEYSVLVADGRTVDAGGVSFYSSLLYTTPNTVGNKLKALDTDVAAVESRRVRDELVYQTSGAGANTPYAITPTPALTSYSAGQRWVVRFSDVSAGVPTFNVNGLGAKSLQVYDSGGARVTANVIAGTVSQVAYDSVVDRFILLDPPPPAAAGSAPRGRQVFTTNGTFTTPADVGFIKVTCVGGGGGGGGGAIFFDPEGSSPAIAGGGGGGGAVCSVYLSTSASTMYSVAIGAGGAAGSNGGVIGVSGAAGGSSSFGVTLGQAAGGSGGIRAISNPGGGIGGAGGVGGSTGVGFVIPGGNGTVGQWFPLTAATSNGIGRGGAAPGFGASNAVYGGGGNGGVAEGPEPLNGWPGVVVVEW